MGRVCLIIAGLGVFGCAAFTLGLVTGQAAGPVSPLWTICTAAAFVLLGGWAYLAYRLERTDKVARSAIMAIQGAAGGDRPVSRLRP